MKSQLKIAGKTYRHKIQSDAAITVTIQCKMMTAVQDESDELACNLTNLLAPDECYPIRHAIVKGI